MGYLQRQSSGAHIPTFQRRTASNLVNNNVDLSARFAENDWYAVFFAADDTLGRLIYVPVDGSGTEMVEDSAVTAKTLATPMRKVSLGNVHYVTSTFFQAVTISEAVIWGNRLSQAECLAAARRMKASAAYRGLSVKMAA
jgi:hypothetical protein